MSVQVQNQSKTDLCFYNPSILGASGDTIGSGRFNRINKQPTFQAVGCEFDPRLPLHLFNHLAASAALSSPKQVQNLRSEGFGQ